MNFKNIFLVCLLLNTSVARARWFTPENVASGVALTGGVTAIVSGIVWAMHSRAQKRRLKKIKHLEHILRNVASDMRDFGPVRAAKREVDELKRSFVVAAAAVGPLVAKVLTATGGAAAVGGAGAHMLMGKGGASGGESELRVRQKVTQEMFGGLPAHVTSGSRPDTSGDARLAAALAAGASGEGGVPAVGAANFERTDAEQLALALAASRVEAGIVVPREEGPQDIEGSFTRGEGKSLKAKDVVTLGNLNRLRENDEVIIKNTETGDEEVFKIELNKVFVFSKQAYIGDEIFIQLLTNSDHVATISTPAKRGGGGGASTSSGASGKGLSPGTWIVSMTDMKDMAVGQVITLYSQDVPFKEIQLLDTGKFVVVGQKEVENSMDIADLTKKQVVDLVGNKDRGITARIGSYL